MAILIVVDCFYKYNYFIVLELSSSVANPFPTLSVYLVCGFFWAYMPLPSVTEVTKKLLEDTALGLSLLLRDILLGTAY